MNKVKLPETSFIAAVLGTCALVGVTSLILFLMTLVIRLWWEALKFGWALGGGNV